MIIVGILVVAIATIGIVKATKSANKELVIRTHVVAEYTAENTVTATGTIEPVETVEVGTQVSGKVEKIYVDFNDVVKKGELLAELDKLTLNQSVSRAKASLTSAESQLNYAKLTYERTKQLYEANAATLAAFQEAQNTYTQAQMSKKNAQAAYDQALVDLGYAEIYSPIDGIVLDRAVEVGQTVAASFSTPTLFTLANDLTKMQVEADVDEADIGQVKVGQHVTFTVDAYMEDSFEGTVSQIRMKPTTTSNVVTYTVIIDAPNPETKLFPGMTASVTITTKKESGVCIPMTALFASIEQDAMKQLEKKGYTFKSLYKNQEELTQGLKDISKKTIWVKTGDKTFEQKSVTVGLNNGVKTLIPEGLREGQEVVISVSEAMEGMPGAGADEGSSNPFKMGPPQRKTR